MKCEKGFQIALIAVFALFIAGFSVLFLFLPKQETSELERRQLADAPSLSVTSVFSGEYGKQMEEYMSDHFPARSRLFGLYSRYELLTGRNGNRGIYLGADDRLYVAPIEYNEQVVDRNCVSISEFADKTGVSVSYMVVPMAGSLENAGLPANHAPYRDEQIIAGIDERLSDFTRIEASLCVDDFYKTDHHWTVQGAYAAYLACAKAYQFEPLEKEAFTVEAVSGFYGTSYAKAGLWEIGADEMELWSGPSALQVEIKDDGAEPIVSDSVFFREALDTMDRYNVYLDGNHGRVRISNSAGQGKLLVIKDSFAQSLVPFLAEHFAQIDMIDLRHFRQMKVSDFVAQEGYTDVLFIYGIESIANSNDLLWLQ